VWDTASLYNCTIVGNQLNGNAGGIGGGGIYVGEAGLRGGMPPNDNAKVQRNHVDNNYIHDYGEVYAAGVGVWLAQSSHNRITNNEIHDGYYSGISVGWNWNKAPNRTHHNTIEQKRNVRFNHV